MKMRILLLPVLPLVLAGIFAGPATAGEEAQAVPLYSDRQGDAGWIEVDRASGRMRATPYLRVSGESVHRAEETARRAGEAREAATADIRMSNETGKTDRKTKSREALSSLLAGPEGVSLGGVLDLARRASESVKGASRSQVRAGSAPLPRQTGER